MAIPGLSPGSARRRTRLTNAFLAFSLLALAASGVTFAVRRATASVPSERESDPAFRLAPLFVPETSPVRVVDAPVGDAGHVGFDLPPGDRLGGILVARAYPSVDGVPQLGAAVDLASTQAAGRLDLLGWLTARSPAGPHLLQLGLRVERNGEEYAWLAWAEFEVSDLVGSDLAVTPRPAGTGGILVRTRGGQAVPGALVSIEPAALAPGAAPFLLSTGDDGGIRLAGLPSAGADLVARLPDGAGPYRKRVETPLATAGAATTLEVPVKGRWRFVEAECLLPLEGVSVEIEAVRAEVASGGVFPVCRWIGPGRGPRTPLWLMSPAVAESADPVRGSVTLTDAEPVEIPDLLRPFRIRIEAHPGRLAVRLVGEEAGDGR